MKCKAVNQDYEGTKASDRACIGREGDNSQATAGDLMPAYVNYLLRNIYFMHLPKAALTLRSELCVFLACFV